MLLKSDTMMKAARLGKDGTVTVQDVPIPEPEVGQARLRVLQVPPLTAWALFWGTAQFEYTVEDHAVKLSSFDGQRGADTESLGLFWWFTGRRL